MLKWMLVSSLIFFSCNYTQEQPSVDALPISPKELLARKGDAFSFRDSTGKYFYALILDVKRSEKGIDFGLCFGDYYDSIPPASQLINNPRLCGRKVASGTEGFIAGFDVVWVPDTTVVDNKSVFLGNLSLISANTIEISGESGVMNYSGLNDDFYRQRLSRSTPPDHYRKDLLKERFRADEYILLKDAIRWNKENDLWIKQSKNY